MRKLFKARIAAKRIEIRIEPQQSRSNWVAVVCVQQSLESRNRGVRHRETRLNARPYLFECRYCAGISHFESAIGSALNKCQCLFPIAQSCKCLAELATDLIG